MEVLLAEDERSSRHGLEEMLRLLGHRVVGVEHGAAAWEVLSRGDAPPVALLDWSMPAPNGPELCRRLRALPTAGDRYLVLVTARTREEGLVEGLDAGADSFLSKPVRMDELRAQLHVAERTLSLRAELRRNEAYLSAVLRHIDAGVLLSDPGGRVVYVNERLVRLGALEAAGPSGSSRTAMIDKLLGRFEVPDQVLAEGPHASGGHTAQERRLDLTARPPERTTLRWSQRSVALPEGEGTLDVFRDVTAEVELSRVLTREATTDHLTGLLNRRGAEQSLAQLLDLARRQHLPLSVAMIDLDRFKRINDELGHAAGDVILREVARLIRASTRASDVVARWGGEELVIAFPGATRAEAAERVEALRARVEALRLPDLPPVTFSAGVDELALSDPDLQAALARADRRLYAAKANGRNRVG